MKKTWKTIFILISLSAISIITLSIVMDWKSFAFLPDFQSFGSDAHTGNPAFAETPKYIRTIGGYLISFLVSVILMYLFPTQIVNVNNRIRLPLTRTAKLTVFGIILIIFMLLIGVGSILSFGTFPFMFFLGFVLFLSMWMGYVAISYKIGCFFQTKSGWFHGSPVMAFLIGHTLLFAISKIPLVNFIILFLLLSLGFGSVVITRFGTNQPWSLSVLKEGYQ